MANFIKESLEELDHVVWPTQAESKKYMIYTIGVIVVMASILAVLWYSIRGGLQWARAQFPHSAIVTTASGEDTVTRADLKSLEDLAEKRKNARSGATLPTRSSWAMLTGSGQ